jgi:hypothetical protein
MATIALPACNNTQAGIPVTSDNNTPSSAPRVKSTQELRRELIEQEEALPGVQLSITGTIEENRILVQKPDFFHHSVYKTDGYIIHGVIHNKASLARFKDAVVQVTFYTETQTDLGSTNYVVYKYLEPNTETPFDLNVYPPAVMRHFSLRVLNASIP